MLPRHRLMRLREQIILVVIRCEAVKVELHLLMVLAASKDTASPHVALAGDGPRTAAIISLNDPGDLPGLDLAWLVAVLFATMSTNSAYCGYCQSARSNDAFQADLCLTP